MDEKEIKDKILENFIQVLRERNGGKFDDVFSYDDIYKIITKSK
jgi:hypothetical protein